MIKGILKSLGMGLRTAWRLGYYRDPEVTVHYDNLTTAIPDKDFSDDHIIRLFRTFVVVNDDDWRLNRLLDLLQKERQHLIVRLWTELSM